MNAFKSTQKKFSTVSYVKIRDICRKYIDGVPSVNVTTAAPAMFTHS